VTAFDIWFPKDERQRVLWPSTVRLSLDYWESLKPHAVPLDDDLIARLSHSALALDIYAWLANRLHRIPANRPATISWPALHLQFGQGYARLDKFRQVFGVALKEVLTLDKAARIEDHSDKKSGPHLHAARPAFEARSTSEGADPLQQPAPVSGAERSFVQRPIIRVPPGDRSRMSPGVLQI
jgi:hypothetical protein